MIVGCYTLDLYCDDPNETHEKIDFMHSAGGEFPHQYTAAYGSQCRAQARRDGWTLNLQKNTAICPKCHGKKK